MTALTTRPRQKRARAGQPTTPRILERDFQRQIIDLARTCGWLVYHCYGQGSVLGSRAIDSGFPDLVLVRNRAVVFAEIKGSAGRLSEEQAVWIAALRVAGVPAVVWFPRDWPDIEALLTTTPTPTTPLPGLEPVPGMLPDVSPEDIAEDVESALPIAHPRAVPISNRTVAVLLPPATRAENIPAHFLPIEDARALYASLGSLPAISGHAEGCA